MTNEEGIQYPHVLSLPLKPRTKSIQTILGVDAHSLNAGQDGILQGAVEEFMTKNDDYDDASDPLHIVGQVSDLWRKVVKLRKSVIDGQVLRGEDAHQLLRDIFGHTLLALYYEELRQRETSWSVVPGYEIISNPNAVAVSAEGDMEQHRDDKISQVFAAMRDAVVELRHLEVPWKNVAGFFNDLQSEPERATFHKAKFMEENGCRYVGNSDPEKIGHWERNFEYRKRGGSSSWDEVCGAKHSMQDIWCLSRKGHGSAIHHLAKLRGGEKYTWPEPEKATDW